MRDIYIKKVSDCTEVRPETLEAELARVASVPQQRQVVRPRDQRRPSAPEMGPERLLLRLMIKDRDWIEKVGERLGPRDFVDVRYRAVFEALLADRDLDRRPEGMVPEAARVLEELLADPAELGQGHQVFEASVNKILSTPLKESLDEVTRKLQNNTLDHQQKTELLLEKKRLSEEYRDFGVQDWSLAVETLSKDNHL